MGPVLQVTIVPTQQHLTALKQQGVDAPQAQSGLALIDTGATMTSVDEKTCLTLGLTPTGVINIAHAGGTSPHNCYPVQIFFPDSKLPPLQIARAASVQLSMGKQPYIMLLGRDILANIKMTYNGPQGRLELAF